MKTTILCKTSQLFARLCLSTGTAAALGFGLSVRAAVITWSNPQFISGDSDVSTVGTLVAAYSLNTANVTINTVPFVPGSASLSSLTSATYGTNFLMTGFTTHYAAFGATNAPFKNLSANYTNLLASGDYVGNLSVAPVITATNLIVGHEYNLQVWANDSRTGRAASDYAYLYGTDGGNTVQMYYNDLGVVGGLGTFSIGDFIANGPAQSFIIYGYLGSGQVDTYLNAIQLRDLGPASASYGIGYWNGLASATLDNTSLNFCTNLDTAPVGTAASLATLESLTNACVFADSYYSSSSPVAVTASNVTVAAGGVSIGSVNFLNSTVSYTLTSSDANGIMDGASPTAVNKFGVGTVIMDGANTYSGGTTINAGTVRVGNGDANGTLGSGPVTDNGALVYDRSDSPTINNTLSGYGSLTQAGSGMLTLAGNNTLIGPTIISSNGNNGLIITGSMNNGAYAGAISIASNSVFNYSGGSQTLSGVISGAGAVSQNNSSTLILTAANTYTGGTTIGSGSTLQLNAAAGAGAKTTIAINGTGTLIVSPGLTVANAITGGSSSVIQINTTTGNSFLTGSLSGFSGTINIGPATTAGQLVINNTNNAANPISAAATWSIASGATLDLATPFIVDPASVIINGSGNNQAFGALRLDACNQQGNVLLNAPNCLIGDGNTNASTISGIISDNGAGYGFTKVSTTINTLVLAAANTYHGATVINSGTLKIAATGSIANSSSIQITNGTTFDVSAVSGFSLGAGQTLTTLGGGSSTINGSVTLSSGASLALTANTSAVSLIVTNGILTLNNNPVTLTVTPSLVAGGTGTYLIISGANGGSVAGNVSSVTPVVNGLLNNAGTPSLTISNGNLYLVMNYPEVASYSPNTYSNLFAFVGSPGPTYSISAGGAGLDYLWYTNGVLAAGATNASFTPVTTNLAPGVLTTTVLVTNALGATSNAWVFTVIATNNLSPYPLAVLSYHPIAYWRLSEPDNGLNNGNAGIPCNDYVGAHYTTYANVNLGYTPGYRPTTDPGETAAQFGVYKTTGSYAGFITNLFFYPGTNFGAPATTNVNLSVVCWAKTAGAPASAATLFTEGIYNTNDGVTLSFNSSHFYRFYVKNAANATINAQSSIAPDGNWHQVAGVLSETNGTATATLYIDGQQAATTSVSGCGLVTIPGTAYATIGAAQVGNAVGNTENQFVNGEISDLALYATNLTEAQVLALYGASGTPPSVAAAVSTNIDQGATLRFDAATVVTGSTPIYYSWFDSNNGNALISTNSVLLITNIAASDTYYLTVSNAFGVNVNNFYLSATVIAGAPVFYTGTSPTYAAVYTGLAATFTVTAYGTYPLYYQWYNAASGAVLGATNSILTENASLGTNIYYCLATNAFNGGSSAASANNTLVGIPLPATHYGMTILTNLYGTVTTNLPPIAYWPLNESEQGGGDDGVIAYDYVGQHNAVYNNVELGQPGYNIVTDSNTAALFGVFATPNSYAAENANGNNEVPNLNFATAGTGNSTAEFSVEAWVKANGAQANSAGIVSKGFNGTEQFVLECTSDEFQFYLRDNAFSIYNCQSAVVANDGNWHHLVGVCDEGGLAAHLYVDGVLQVSAFGMQPGKSVVDPGDAVPLADQVNIGARAASGSATTLTEQFDGTIQDVALYNYALSSGQISQHYSAGIARPPLIPFYITGVTNGGGAGVTLTWQSVAGYSYQVQVASSLAPANWTTLITKVATGTTTSYIDTSTNATHAAAYYQVVGQ